MFKFDIEGNPPTEKRIEAEKECYKTNELFWDK